MKTCHKCKIEKRLEDFPVNKSKKSGRSETCLLCKREYNRVHYQNNKKYYVDKTQRSKSAVMEFLKKVKSGLKCKVCGEDHPAALHFHHENPKEKEANISDALARGWSVKRIEGEIKKCSVLCARCHAIWHWEQKHGPWV